MFTQYTGELRQVYHKNPKMIMKTATIPTTTIIIMIIIIIIIIIITNPYKIYIYNFLI